MSKIRTLLVALALMIGVFAVSRSAEAATCYAWAYQGTPFQFCTDLRPDPLPGFTMVSPSYVVQPGEFKMCTTQGGGFCQKNAMGPGGFYNIPNLGDWAGNATFYIQSIESRLNNSVGMYSQPNFSGWFSSYDSDGALATRPNVPGANPGYRLGSLTLQN